MKERILEALYDLWCEKKEGVIVQVAEAKTNIYEKMHATEKEKVFIDTELENAVSAGEKAAFFDGVSMAAELFSGRFMQ